jgi:DNA-binding FadR family transcriptional regulator
MHAQSRNVKDRDTVRLRVKPLRRGAASEQVLKQLRAAIVSSDAGARLPSEPELATSFGVSKSVIREAVKVLASQGLVTVRQGSGTTVNDRASWNVFDPDVLLATRRYTTLADLIEARRLVEPDLARLAAERAGPTEKARIAEMLKSERAPVDEHAATDVEFHRRIAQAAGNPILVILLDSIGILLSEHRRELYGIPGSVERALSFHRQVYDAIEAGDPAAAAAAMHAHLDQVAADFADLQARRSGGDGG